MYLILLYHGELLVHFTIIVVFGPHRNRSLDVLLSYQELIVGPANVLMAFVLHLSGMS